MMVDAHTHIGLKSFVIQPISEEKLKRPAFRDPLENSIENLIARMDANGVTRAVTFAYPLEEVDAVLANEYVFAAQRAYPDRVIPFALIGDDVERWANAGARGFKEQDILQAPERFDLKRAYALVAETGKPLLLHACSRTPSEVSDKIKGMLRDAPRLKVIVAHMGRHTPNTAQHVEENLLALRDEPNVYFETSTVREPAIIARAVELLGEERVLFGSDFPFNSYQDLDPLAFELDVIRRTKLTPRIIEKILGKNILRLLEL
jgi:hypothetical protein